MRLRLKRNPAAERKLDVDTQVVQLNKKTTEYLKQEGIYE